MRRFIVKQILFSIGLLAPLSAMADASGGASAASGLNVGLLMMGLFVVVLIVANAMLAIVLKRLAEALLEKKLRDRNADSSVMKTVALLVLMLLPAAGAFAQGNTAAAADVVAVESPFINGIPRGDFYFLALLTGFLLVVMLAQLLVVRGLVRVLRGIPMKTPPEFILFRKNFLDIFNKSVAVEKEDAITLDHDYDGIRELDNDLPPWWKWGFVLTIVVSFIYMGYYHAWGGPSQLDEYNAAVSKAEEEKAAYLAKAGAQVDENTVTMVLDAGQLADAKALFNNVCAACHRADGGGQVGPNLTDDYWLHGGSLKDVFKSIKYGWRDKGMPPWDGNLSATQIAAISSYVKTLKDTKPVGGKAPQGELFVEGGDKSIDSVSNKTEPSLTPSGTTENKNNPIGPFKNKADGKGEGTPPGKVK